VQERVVVVGEGERPDLRLQFDLSDLVGEFDKFGARGD